MYTLPSLVLTYFSIMMVNNGLLVSGITCEPCYSSTCKLSRPSGTSTTFYFGAALGMTTCLDVQKSIDSGSVTASECNDIRRVTRTTANRCMCRNPSTGAICDAPLSEYEIFQAPPACKANGKSCTMNSNCCSKRCSKGSNGKKKCKKASRLRRDLSSEPVDGQSDKRLKATKHDFLETIGTQRLRHLRSLKN